jgi:hypothetical protein
MSTRKKIVVMGFMGGCPIAGVVWQHIHYLVGLQRLGHEVYYIEDSARHPYDPIRRELSEDYSYAVKFLAEVAARFGFEKHWAYCARFVKDEPACGLSQRRIADLYREADAILNVCGSQEFNEDLLQSDRLIYVESDPGVEQIRVDTGQESTINYLRKHRALFTFGEHIGSEKFPVPLGKFQWLPTRQPVVTDLWKTDAMPGAKAVFTSVANWSTSGIKDIEWRGDNYLWSKSREFLRFVEAPLRCGEDFELATEIRDPETVALFQKNRWHLTSPDAMSVDYDEYRRYLQNSKGEFTVAKDQYVRLHTGWFSDRSACYLAAGRPVVTQETGFTDLYGGERGLLAFKTIEEIVDSVARINSDYAAHSRAASEIAREFFEAEKVLSSLLDRAGV